MGKLSREALEDLIPEGIKAMAPDARAALVELQRAAAGHVVVDADLVTAYVERVTQAAALKERRRRSTQAAEDGRRTVGARIPAAEADRYKAAAAAQGVSLYAWVRTALKAAADAQEGGEIMEDLIRCRLDDPEPDPHPDWTGDKRRKCDLTGEQYGPGHLVPDSVCWGCYWADRIVEDDDDM